MFRYDKLQPFYVDALKHPVCSHIEMQGGDEWNFIVTSKKKLLKTIDNNMFAIRSPMPALYFPRPLNRTLLLLLCYKRSTLIVHVVYIEFL